MGMDFFPGKYFLKKGNENLKILRIDLMHVIFDIF